MIDKTLIQKTVYFYKSDVEKWNALEKKTQFLHNALNTSGQSLSSSTSSLSYAKLRPDKTPKVVRSDTGEELDRSPIDPKDIILDGPKWEGPIPKKKK